MTPYERQARLSQGSFWDVSEEDELDGQLELFDPYDREKDKEIE